MKKLFASIFFAIQRYAHKRGFTYHIYSTIGYYYTGCERNYLNGLRSFSPLFYRLKNCFEWGE